MVISVTSSFYWQLTWFRCRCWRERNWWDWLCSIKTQDHLLKCSYPTADETPYSTRWIKKTKATPGSTSLTVADGVISYRETRMLSTYGERSRPARCRSLAAPPAEDAQGRAGVRVGLPPLLGRWGWSWLAWWSSLVSANLSGKCCHPAKGPESATGCGGVYYAITSAVW